MAHFEKFKGINAFHMIEHDTRENTYLKENIDNSRSYMNYNLCDIENPKEYLKELINKAKSTGATIRDDTNFLISLCLTLPETFPHNEELKRQYFKAAVELMAEDFGRENIVSAWVHCDECIKNENRKYKEHIHIKIAPMHKKIKKYKDGREKEMYIFNTHQCINRTYLQKFHDRLDAYMEEWLGFKTDVKNGATKDGNKTIKQLKQISEQQRKARTEIENDPILQEAERKQILDQMWKKYKEESAEYWTTYKSLKQDIKDKIYEMKKGVQNAEYELQRSLDILHNLTRGIFYTLLKLLSAIFIYSRKKALENNLKAVEGKYEALETERRSISNYQNNTKKKLLAGDFEGIVQAMENWEKAVINANAVIRDEMIEREIYKQKEKEIDKVL